MIGLSLKLLVSNAAMGVQRSYTKLFFMYNCLPICYAIKNAYILPKKSL